MKKHYLVIVSIIFVIFLSFSTGIFAEDTIETIHAKVMEEVNASAGKETENLQVKAAILADPVTKNIIFEQNADETLYPASVTKLMSFVIVYEGINNGTYKLTDPVTISSNVEAITEGDIGLKAGETWTLQELLFAMEILSANDASVAVAEHIAGSESAYVEEMNAKAAELSMSNTHFMNSTGLHDENHYSTARDMLTLSFHAIEVPGILDLTETQSHTFTLSTGQLTAYNTNKLLMWYPGTDGLKTGFTTPAGRCLAATAAKDGIRLVSVVLGGVDNKYSHYSESMKLLNYGFSHYKMADAVTADKTTSMVFLPKGKVEEVKAVAKETLSVPTAISGDPGYEIEWRVNLALTAPVSKGDTIGRVVVVANGEDIVSTRMIAGESVKKQNIFQAAFRYIRDLF